MATRIENGVVYQGNVPIDIAVQGSGGPVRLYSVIRANHFAEKLILSAASKVMAANGAATTYTYPANTSYVYLTTTAASLAITLPAGVAAIDGLEIKIVPSAAVATVTWASTGATFVGAPAAFVINTPVRLIYDQASLKWYVA